MYTQRIMSNPYSTPRAGGGGGDRDFQIACPGNNMLTGLAMKLGTDVDGLSGIYCKPPNQLDNSTPGTYVQQNVASGDNQSIYQCPAGSAMGDVSIGDDGVVQNVTIKCRRLRDAGIMPQSQQYGRNSDRTTPISCRYMTGVTGRSGKYIDSMGFTCANFDQAQWGLYTDEGKVRCCMGQMPGEFCNMSPQDGNCDQFMIRYCQTPTGFADPRCSCLTSEMNCPNKFDVNCIKNNGYRSSDMIKAACPNVMNCTQFVSLSPGAQAIATNVQQDCASAQTTGATKTTTPISATMPSSTSNTTSLTTGSGLLWLFIIIFILILVAVAVYLVASGDDDEPEPAPEY